MNPIGGLVIEPSIVKASPMFSIKIANIAHTRSKSEVMIKFHALLMSSLNKSDSIESFAGSMQRGVANMTVNKTQQIPIVNPTLES